MDYYKQEQKNDKNKQIPKSVYFSFYITYVLLLTTATITFIEAIRTQNPKIRHILNLETCISIVAGYFYSLFIVKLDESQKENNKIKWSEITQTRYIDWSITTPLMLLTLCLVLGSNIQKTVPFSTFIIIVFLNYLMLYIGYLGEEQQINRTTASIFGFIPFIGMFYLIFSRFVLPKFLVDNYILFTIYVIIWSLYGIVYLLSEESKNVAMNILDFTSKCFIGIGLWAYYTKIFT
jgi:bacteriorhodopsin